MEPENDYLKLRNSVYAFLQQMFLEEAPRKLASDLVKGTFPVPIGLRTLNPDIDEGIELLLDYIQKCKNVDEVHDRLQKEFTILFIGPGSSPVPPYETMYIDHKMSGPTLLELKKVYRHAGIEKKADYPEPEDNIAFEMRFMNYLCEKAMQDNTNTYLEMQKEFMDEHLLKWVPDFCDDLFINEYSDFYKWIAKFTKGFLVLDRSMLNELLQ
ncbi:MAG: molecular chaperone TorD family protein [Methanosarcinaceae archaeon]|nr:molecular chaperone TorD family protein [Methanosarcinaceae archaeon]